MIKPRRMRWVGHVARMGERTGVYRVLAERPEVKNQSEDPGVDGRIILGWMCQEFGCRGLVGSMWLGIETGGWH